jgi:hypothetical protein
VSEEAVAEKPPEPVIVENASDAAVPVEVQNLPATQEVTGTIDIGTAARPIPVSDGHQPWQRGGQLRLDRSHYYAQVDLAPVPAGQILTIQDFNAVFDLHTADLMLAQLSSTQNPAAVYQLPITRRPIGSRILQQVGGPLTFHVWSGARPHIFVSYRWLVSSGLPDWQYMGFLLSGYLQRAQSSVGG